MEENTLAHMGRPTKYTAKTIEQGWNYVKNWKVIGDRVPSNSGLAHYLEISRRTVQEWANDDRKPDFLHMLGRIQTIQERELINKGLSSDFNSNICKLMLAKHGYADKQELTGKDGEPFERAWTVTYVKADVEGKKEEESENGNGSPEFPEID